MTLSTASPIIHKAWLQDRSDTALNAQVRLEIPTRYENHPVIASLRDELDSAPALPETTATTTPTGDAPQSEPQSSIIYRIEPNWTDTGDTYEIATSPHQVTVTAGNPRALLYGHFALLRRGAQPFTGPATERQEPKVAIRMLDHWDNMSVHPVMGQVERGYSGDSIFYSEGKVRADLSRVEQYARLIASIGINHVAINNVNVGREAARLLTDNLHDVARIAEIFRRWGIHTHLSVSFGSPQILGGLDTTDPLDPGVQAWWANAADRVYESIPDFGGFVVKADSEGQPGPFAYGRTHADGANMIAQALAPHGGIVHWRAFVYNHTQDWRDRSTDRARAAYEHFAPHDGTFADNAIVQIKFGPMDFQTREPISPTFAAMPRTNLSLEFQVTQEYTGQQKHICYLGTQWAEIMRFQFWPDSNPERTLSDLPISFTAVSNVGMSEFWTGHPLAQANLYAYGRLTWDPTLDPAAILSEWSALTFPETPAAALDEIEDIMNGSWRTYELYTAPLGVGFMVSPTHMHYGPSIDGYEYSPWGTYHFADRDGVGVDRTFEGTGYAAQYPEELAKVYNSLDTCPDELLLFFHHVPYTHVLHSGKTVIQHIYDTHFEGVEAATDYQRRWAALEGQVPSDVFAEVTARLVEQVRCATEWRDQMCTYFLRKSGINDDLGRQIF